MIGPTKDWSQLHIVERFLVSASDAPPKEAIKREARAALVTHGLREQPDEIRGHRLVLPRPSADQPSYLARSKVYSLALADDVLAATRAQMALIAEEHGPGDVWFLDGPIGYGADWSLDTGAIAAARIEGDQRAFIFLRTYYGHESQLAPY